MKRLMNVMVILALFALVMSACGPAAAAEPAAPATIKVATDATFPPFEIVDENTMELTGFDMDLIRAVAERAGLTIELINTPFDSVLAGLANCDYDVAIAAISVTPDRQAAMLFTDPYINAGQVVVVREGVTDITGVQDLVGRSVAAQLGTTGEIEAQRIENVNYRPYDTYDLAFLDLANGQVDAVIADYLTALGFIAQNPGLMTVGDVFTDESYSIAVCAQEPELRDQLNAALNAVIADGTLAEIEARWLTAPAQ